MKKRLVWCALLAALCLSGQAQAHLPRHHQRLAVTWAFCGHSFKPCRYGNEAIVVASLESNTSWKRGRCWEARNGQYRGCFQMGERERHKYGNGYGVWNQAKAAYRYFVATGRDWSPWSCKPWGVCW